MTTRWMLVAILGGLAISGVGAQQGGPPAKRPPVQSPRVTPDQRKGDEEPSRLAKPFGWPGDLPHEGLLDLDHGPPVDLHLDDSFMGPPLLDWPSPGFGDERIWHLDDIQPQIATMDHDFLMPQGPSPLMESRVWGKLDALADGWQTLGELLPPGRFGLGWGERDGRMPEAWSQGTPVDSLYRTARESLNRGEYRRAASVLREIPQKYPNSAYASEALYWQAYALYRIGGNTDLQDALSALEQLRAKYPAARTQADAQSLATRIQGSLAVRGDARAAAVLARTASANPGSCDREDQMVRTEALNALSRMDPGNFSALMRTILSRKDECSAPLRRSAVFLIGEKRDAGMAALLASVAKSDPDLEVRGSAIDWLARVPSDEGLATLAELARNTSEDERIQRAAVRALAVHPSDQARQLIRSLVERNDVSDRLRAEALASFERERTSSDDVAWLRSIYTKLDNRQLKQRALSAIVRVSGPETDQWLMSIVKDDDEPSDLRATALRRIGKSMPIADIGKLYDASSARAVREQLINILGERKENDATDKLIEIVKTGTDPNLRAQAIGAMASKNDPRTRALLMEIVNK